ncbi:Glc8 protein [Saccharomycopsis crataegensis]|uniref:Glc8 protein n=1 Tax=Saccharomycopsis crataegensis TaxID=43959 RepID=A0AAV5QFP3_9ASCO|nr:Glc8 protein [Saccharomycopsis crataegensis]
MSETEHPKGILRNSETHDYSHPVNSDYDRKLVLENTKKNAELFKQTSSEGDKIREEIARKKKLHDDGVHFNKENLEENDKLKASMTFTKIDEPKTPYQGPISEENDYYRDDNEDDENDKQAKENGGSIPDFSLGEGECDVSEGEVFLDSLHGSKIIPSEKEEINEPYPEAEKELSPEELKHKKFEEMRKKHYHNEVINPLKMASVLTEEEDDEEED